MSDETEVVKPVSPKKEEPVKEEPKMTQEEEKSDIEFPESDDEKQVQVETNPIDFDELSARDKINVEDVCLALDEAGMGEVKQPSAPKKIKYKADYIKSIKKLCGNKFSDRMLKRMRVQQLKELLAKHWEKAAIEEVGSLCSEPQALPQPNTEMLVKTMYQCTLLICTGLEMATKKASPWLGGYCLHNFARNVDRESNREALLQILSELEAEHHDLVASYCSKEARLVLIFSLSAINSIKKMDDIENAPQRRHYDPKMERASRDQFRQRYR